MVMKILGFDHVVISARDPRETVRFYSDILGMEAREEKPRKWSLYFGDAKISIQDASRLPSIATRTLPGTANFCLFTETAIEDVVEHLATQGIKIVDGPGERRGATGPIMSVYFYDPDGNLVEVCNRLV